MKNRCRISRTRAHLSEAEAAQLLGIEPAELVAIEADDTAFLEADRGKISHARLAALYRVDVDWLRGDRELRDYAAVDCIEGAEKLTPHDRDVVAEFAASLPRRSR